MQVYAMKYIGGRPRKYSPRAKRVAVTLEPAQLRAAQKAAALQGDTLPDFCRDAIVKATGSPLTPVRDPVKSPP